MSQEIEILSQIFIKVTQIVTNAGMLNKNLINNFVSAKRKFSTNIRDAESTCDMLIVYIMNHILPRSLHDI